MAETRAAMSHFSRYDRQARIEGWDQKRLENASIAIIGAGGIAALSAASLAALGVGRIQLFDNSKISSPMTEPLMFNGSKGDSKAEVLADLLKSINPSVEAIGIHMRVNSEDVAKTLLIGQNTIIEAGKDESVRQVVSSYANSLSLPIINAEGIGDSGTFIFHLNSTPTLRKTQADARRNSIKKSERIKVILDEEEAEKKNAEILAENQNRSGKRTETESIISSEIIGGFVAARITGMLMPSFGCSVQNLTYNYSLQPLSAGRSLADKNVLMVGAGALGNFVGLGLAHLGIRKLTIIDSDIVETTNLNRQMLFYDSVGKQKSKALASKLRKINPNLNAAALIMRMDERFNLQRMGRVDLIVDCTDNFAARAFANYYAITNQIPLISGGTSPFAGQVATYVPGKSPCLDCRFGVDKLFSEEKQAATCLRVPEASVIVTNEIIGGVMVGESKAVLSGDRESTSKTIKCDLKSPRGAGLMGISQPCNCTRPAVNEWLKMLGKERR